MLSHQAQANDNRSKIVVKTCKIIQLFSENLKNSFDRIASNIFPTYLEKVSSGITVFAFFCPHHQVISSSIAQTCLTMTKNIVMKTNITVITTSIDNRRYAFPSLPFLVRKSPIRASSAWNTFLSTGRPTWWTVFKPSSL